MLIFLYNVVYSSRRGQRAGNDPWDGATLEWTVSSPPPHYNFATIPTVTSARPYWDIKYGIGHGAHPLPEEPIHGAAAHTAPAAHHEPEDHSGHHDHDDDHHAHVPMPDPSYWPVVAALGMSIFMGGLILLPNTLTPTFGPQHFLVSFLGLVIMVIGVYAWSLEPVRESE
jgi:hypothetical protein